METWYSNWTWAETAQIAIDRSQRRRRRTKLRYRITTALMGLVTIGLAVATWLLLS